MVRRQREFMNEAHMLREESAELLRPFHDDLQETSRAYDGLTHFPLDRGHTGQASAAVGLRPDAENEARHEFYTSSIDNHRVDLGATALGQALRQAYPRYLPSRMNPKQHMTWARRTVIDNSLTGGLQVAFRPDMGELPTERAMEQLWREHQTEINEVAHGFFQLAKKVESIGNTMELESPVTPNAYIIGWDLSGSTLLAEERYATLRNYLLEVKGAFFEMASDRHSVSYDDTGDGQHLIIWLPPDVDQADPASVHRYLNANIAPLVDQMRAVHVNISRDYRDIDPKLRFAVGLAFAERDRQGQTTTPELWRLTAALNNQVDEPVALTDTVQNLKRNNRGVDF